MKYLLGLCLALLFLGCSTKKELSRDNALALIKEAYHYPETWDYEIFTADPDQVKKLTAGGLEDQGFVTINHHPRLMDMGKPLIQLTGKASSYVLPVQANDAESKIVRVKAGDVDMVEVTGIKMLSSGKAAVAEYTTVFKNLTPFASLRGITADKHTTKKAYFSLYDDGWRIEKKPGVEFLSN
jgi:hypothetical protein